jgi:hypothetical protein
MSEDGGKQVASLSEGTKIISELLLVTLPAVLIYFLGWAYLYFYLGAFGINVSELDLDIQTVLIYSFPAIRGLISSYWYLVLIAVLALVAIIWVLLRFNVPLIVEGLVVFAFLICTAVLSYPFIRSVAEGAAKQNWPAAGARISAMSKGPEGEGAIGRRFYAYYMACSDRDGLNLIFADKESYYMLCSSTKQGTTGLVFEVRRDVGVVSVRMVERPN